jgi:hypothetical protein
MRGNSHVRFLEGLGVRKDPSLLGGEPEYGTSWRMSSGSLPDRTGLLLAYYLVREAGLSVAEAMEELRRVRPCALTALGWYQFAIDILRRST